MSDDKSILVVGTGPGLSASIARRFAKDGMNVALAARNTEKLKALCDETGGRAYTCDVAERESVDRLFADVVADFGTPDVVVFNASRRVRGPFIEIDPDEVREAVLTTGYSGFLVAQAAAKLMVPAGRGTIMLTGASAGVKGYPQSATFAMGKFALRGLAQSMARELHPQNIHVVHVVVDGGIKSEARGRDDSAGRGEDAWLDPDAIADTYYHLYSQHRSSWSWEIEVRPWVESF